MESVAQRHQFKIAKSTLRMSDAGALIMGGMSKLEARQFLRSMGWTDRRIARLEGIDDREATILDRIAADAGIEGKGGGA